MKTLDEVIKAYEVCHASVLSCEGCPYDNGERYRDSDCYIADALHYLKEYREKSHQLDIGIAENRRFFEQYGEEMQRIHEIEDEYHELKDWWAEEYVTNDPLTWDELKQMEGKPVWVEDNNGWYKNWVVIEKFEEDDMFTTGFTYEKNNFGTVWQAYRKERK